jgi:hypothetical protein
LHDLLITPALLCSPLGEWFAHGAPASAQTYTHEKMKSTLGRTIAPHRRDPATIASR